VANGDFLQMFDNCSVENIITTSSDHFAILITIAKSGDRTAINPVQNSFRFEAAWIRAPDYHNMIEENWKNLKDGVPSLNSTWSALNKLSGSIQTWSKASFGSVKKDINKLGKRLAALRRNSSTMNTSDEEKHIEQRLCELFAREEIMARQRSRVDWLRKGDHNTSFFHARASARRRTNRINFSRRLMGQNVNTMMGLKVWSMSSMQISSPSNPVRH
jgi:hypothetical protein